MPAFGLTSDVLQDTQVLDTQPSSPRRGISRLLASLRASMALVAGRYPCGRRRLKPSRELSEVDPVERLARMMILPPYC
jgi:hypothetical protein